MENDLQNLLKYIENIIVLLKSSGLEIESSNTQEFSIIIKNLLNLYLSKYRIVQFSTKEDSIEVINCSLRMLNSKYLLVENYDPKRFIFFFLYFLIEYDILNDYLEHLYKNFKKLNLVKIEFLFKIAELLITKEEKRSTSQNLLSLFNNINFNFKNIKKQVDIFINLSFKLNKQLNNPETIKLTKTTLKIEEILLFNEKIFNNYEKLTEDSSLKFEEYFNLLKKIIEKIPKLVDNSLRLFNDNLVLEGSEINPDYNIDNKNIEIKKVRKIFASYLKFDENYSKSFQNWVAKLQENLNLRLVALKEKQDSLLNSSEMKDFLTNLASKLEEYFEENIRDLSDFGFSVDVLKKSKEFVENNEKNEDYIGFDRLYNHINKKTEFLSSEFEVLNKRIIEKLKISYDIYNA